jgi:hypothetical protein
MIPSRRAVLAVLTVGFAGCAVGPESGGGPSDGSLDASPTPDTATDSRTGSLDAFSSPTPVTTQDVIKRSRAAPTH